MATDPEDEDADDEWRFSLSDLEDEDGDDTGSNAAESSTDASGTAVSNDVTESSAADEDEATDDGGIDAGVAGTLDVEEELEAGDVNVENALFVLVGVVLALLFVAGFLNLWP